MSAEVVKYAILPALAQSVCRPCQSKWLLVFPRLCTGYSNRHIHTPGCLSQLRGRQLCEKENCKMKLRRFYVTLKNSSARVINEDMSTMLSKDGRQLHLSSVDCAAKAKNAKRRIMKPINVRKKGMMSTSGSAVEIRPMMTVDQIAEAMDRDTDHVFEVLLYIDGGERYEDGKSVIDNLQVLKKIVKMSGFRYTVISQDKREKTRENKDVVRQPPPDPSLLVKRPPVVTVMGHVDHGKTTLLDALRKSNIVAQEFGGITQHIAAFSVTLPSGESITFLDTPGHAAFSAMRARGAQVTDIIVLVLAADDGVMQQTIESIQHAKNAQVPIVVAINKIDKPEADIEKTKKMLLEHDVVLEDFGGEVQSVPISALRGSNLVELQETIVTLAELCDLKADPTGLVEGRVVEAKTDLGRGKLVTALISRGVLTKGCYLVAGNCWAKVRGLFSDKGKPILEAPPSTPVEIIGWKELPSAGDEILQVQTEQEVKEVIAWRKHQDAALKLDETHKQIEEKRAEHQQVYQEQLKKRLASGYRFRKSKPKTKEVIDQHEGPSLSLILKGDVDGSLEAILDTLDTYNSTKCRLNLVHYGVGNVTESDIELAEAFKGEIYGFNVDAGSSIVKLAKTRNVSVKLHNVIYRLLDDLRESLSARLPMMEEEEIVGEANILQIFDITDGKKRLSVAGCRCVKGTLNRKKRFKLLRNGETIYTGTLDSLKHHKNEVEAIKTDVECGLSFSDKNIEFREGDIVVCYSVTQTEQDIDWEPNF